PSSIILNDRLENITKPNTIASLHLSEFADFDIINLDFCDSVTQVREGRPVFLDSIRAIVEIQSKKRVQPWVLFLTTRALRSDLDADLKEKLLSTVLENIKANPEFNSAMEAKLSLTEELIKNELASNSASDKEWLILYLLGICKWLLRLMMREGYAIGVTLMPSYVYGVQKNQEDMIACGFRFERVIPSRKDLSGITSSADEDAPIMTEAELAIKMIDEIGNIKNVDQFLESQPENKGKITKQAINFMKELRYDSGAYEKFITSD